MKQFAFRTAFAASLAVLLAACGANDVDDLSTRTAAMSASSVVAVNSPAPDCAAEGCSSLRIIDANAETYRYDALRRAAADPQS
ncbi:hypothetical protein [uncultured Massilia sp.]|uniref:hypothetical protein n=1 Tax=uncultured Massilia sp. TaxID=169973 RepID=UPI0025D26D1F|nr:hypothetical protein [uncultured Massilia sp.]